MLMALPRAGKAVLRRMRVCNEGAHSWCLTARAKRSLELAFCGTDIATPTPTGAALGTHVSVDGAQQQEVVHDHGRQQGRAVRVAEQRRARQCVVACKQEQQVGSRSARPVSSSQAGEQWMLAKILPSKQEGSRQAIDSWPQSATHAEQPAWAVAKAVARAVRRPAEEPLCNPQRELL